MATDCLTGQYIYVCGSQCAPSCLVPVERKEDQICYICDSHLLRGQMSSIAIANKMALSPIPAELHQLNVLERRLIAKILPFAKIISSPKGQQKAVHGDVVCLPPEVEAAVNALLTPKDEVQLPQVKLKWNIKYKGYQHCDTVKMFWQHCPHLKKVTQSTKISLLTSCTI